MSRRRPWIRPCSWPLGRARATFLLLLLLVCQGAGNSVARSDEWTRGPEFLQATNRWISLALQDERNELRQVCDDLARTQRVAVLIDRRIDPGQPILLPPPIAGTFREVLTRVANSLQLELRIFGDAVYLLPADQATALKTLAALRGEELSADMPANVPREPNRLKKILERRLYAWESFSRPRDLVREACRVCNLNVTNAEEIPHDLWYQGALPRAQLVEFLTFVLLQYDLTFDWAGADAITLVPIPARIEITRSHQLTASVVSEQLPTWREQYPEARWEQQGTRWRITGPEDLHELLAESRRPERNTTVDPRTRWDTRVFTMRVQQKPLGEVLNYLKQAGLPVEFEATQLAQQGHDPLRLISFEVTNANVKGLFQAICGPLRIPYTIDAERIVIGQEPSPPRNATQE